LATLAPYNFYRQSLARKVRQRQRIEFEFETICGDGRIHTVTHPTHADARHATLTTRERSAPHEREGATRPEIHWITSQLSLLLGMCQWLPARWPCRFVTLWTPERPIRALRPALSAQPHLGLVFPFVGESVVIVLRIQNASRLGAELQLRWWKAHWPHQAMCPQAEGTRRVSGGEATQKRTGTEETGQMGKHGTGEQVR
jgi:hypothetical protein